MGKIWMRDLKICLQGLFRVVNFIGMASLKANLTCLKFMGQSVNTNQILLNIINIIFK